MPLTLDRPLRRLYHLDKKNNAAFTRCRAISLKRRRISVAPEVSEMVMLEFSIFPIDKGESLSPYVSRCLDIVDKSGVPYKLNPMGTVLEGDWDQVFGVVKGCYEELSKDCNRIEIAIKVDARAKRAGGLDSKVKSIESKIGRELKK